MRRAPTMIAAHALHPLHRMKIGLVRRGFSDVGGAEAYLLRFAEAARAAGHEPVLICGTEWPDNVWPHEMVKIAGRGPEDFADHLEDRKESKTWDALFSLERVWSCDVFRAGDGVHASWLERRHQFEPAWRGWFRDLQRKHREILELECALFTGGARRVIANSQMVKDEIIRFYGTAADHVHVVHNGVPLRDPEPGAREKWRANLGLGPADYVALFAGSGWDRKGLRHAVAAVNALKTPATLLVAGRDEARGKPASARVHFLGAVPGAQMPGVYAAADVFILPTLYDPFSNACIEAMAAGLPVITTTANGFAEIIEHRVEGDAVAPGDVGALHSALESWADPARRGGIRPRLVEKARGFSMRRNLERTLEVITAAVP